MLTLLGQDIRAGFRWVAHQPLFSAAAVVMLALGVGMNGAVFSMLNGTILHPVPWKDAERLIVLQEENLPAEIRNQGMSYSLYLDLLGQTRSFSDLLAARGVPFIITENEREDVVSAAWAVPRVFPSLGIDVALGRGLIDDDVQPSTPRVLVISNECWVERYQSDPKILGRVVQVDGKPATIVGVLAADAWFPAPDVLYIAPLREPEAQKSRILRDLLVLAKLAPDVGVDQARKELGALRQRIAEANPETDADWSIKPITLTNALFPGFVIQSGVLVMMGAVGSVLLICCANVASLLLARAAGRQHEIAVRAALGATRVQIVTQLLVESLALALVALPLAVGVTHATIQYIYLQVPPEVSGMQQIIRFDAEVWIFVGILTLLSVLAFGVTPALHASRVDVGAALKAGGERGSTARGSLRLRSALVVAQTAAAVVLVVMAALFIQSFDKQINADPGFELAHLFYAPIALPQERYPEALSWIQFQEQIGPRIESIPGVLAAGVVDVSASSSLAPRRAFAIKGKPERSAPNTARWAALSPGYYRALGIRLLQGRVLADTDDARSRKVAMISDRLRVENFDAGESPLGQFVRLADGTELEIVGVFSDVKQIGLPSTGPQQIFVPFAQHPTQSMGLIARTSLDPLSIGTSVRREIAGLDPQIPLHLLSSVEKQRSAVLWPIRFFTAIMALLATLSLVLAALGTFGVMSYSTAQRAREFGIRMALGAEPSAVATLVLRQAARLAVIGIALGIVLGAGLSRALTSLLYDVDPFDPISFGATALVLVAAAFAASLLPALRATRTEPVEALRQG